jgi:hypothetical protein
MLTEIKFYTEKPEHIATEYFRTGFTTTEVVARCKVFAKVHGEYVVGVRPDGFSCGFHGPEDE